MDASSPRHKSREPAPGSAASITEAPEGEGANADAETGVHRNGEDVPPRADGAGPKPGPKRGKGGKRRAGGVSKRVAAAYASGPAPGAGGGRGHARDHRTGRQGQRKQGERGGSRPEGQVDKQTAEALASRLHHLMDHGAAPDDIAEAAAAAASAAVQAGIPPPAASLPALHTPPRHRKSGRAQRRGGKAGLTSSEATLVGQRRQAAAGSQSTGRLATTGDAPRTGLGGAGEPTLEGTESRAEESLPKAWGTPAPSPGQGGAAKGHGVAEGEGSSEARIHELEQALSEARALAERESETADRVERRFREVRDELAAAKHKHTRQVEAMKDQHESEVLELQARCDVPLPPSQRERPQPPTAHPPPHRRRHTEEMEQAVSLARKTAAREERRRDEEGGEGADAEGGPSSGKSDVMAAASDVNVTQLLRSVEEANMRLRGVERRIQEAREQEAERWRKDLEQAREEHTVRRPALAPGTHHSPVRRSHMHFSMPRGPQCTARDAGLPPQDRGLGGRSDGRQGPRDGDGARGLLGGAA